jgi:hypothetical protein
MHATRNPPLGWVEAHRRTIRLSAAGLATTIAALYLLIGVKAVAVIDDVEGQPAFGLPAAAAFAVAAILLLVVDRRWLWAIGAILQLLIIVTYVAVAGDRSPQFELWGILIRIAQVAFLATLIALALPRPRSVPTAATRATA